MTGEAVEGVDLKAHALAAIDGLAKYPAGAVLLDVLSERVRQDQQWGGPDHDDEHDVWDWPMFIEKQIAKLDDVDNDAEFRERMIKIAALAVAGVQSLDRKRVALSVIGR